MLYGNLFAKRILERGYRYYLDGAVYNVVKEGQVYKGTVKGTTDYQVEIQISDQFKVTQMHCTCPYAQDGKKCKHEAAVLLEIFGVEAVMGDMEDEYNDYDDYYDYEDYDEYDDEEYDDWEKDYDFYEPEVYKGHEILEPLEKKSKSDILDIISMALKDSKTYQVFLDLLHNDQRIESIQNMIRTYISLSRNIQQENYQKIYFAIQNLQDVHQEQSIPMLANEALCHMLNVFLSLESFQEDFFFNMIELIEKYSPTQFEKREFYDYPCIQYHQPVIYRFMDHLYKQNYSFENIIKQLENKINLRFTRFSLKPFYQKYIYIIYYYQFSSFQDMVKKYSQDQNFAIELIKFYIQVQQYEKAENMCLQEIKKMDHIEFYKLLIEIYQQTQQNDKLMKVYIQLLCHKYSGQIQYYHQLKEICPSQQWEQIKQEVIRSLEKQQVNLCAIYAEEKMYDSLMNYFMKSHDMIEIRKYEDILFKEQTSKMLSLYKEFIMESLKQRGTREFYQNIATYIFKIDDYDEQLSHQIVEELEQLYPQRYAMIEEIQIKKPVKAQLSQIIEAIEMSDDWTIWVYRQSDGKVLPVYDEIDDDVKEIVFTDDDYISLPARYEINEYHIMEMFIAQLSDQNMQNILSKAICGKGAFRRFKNLIHQNHIQDDWYRFLNQEYRNIAIRWCRKYDVPFDE